MSYKISLIHHDSILLISLSGTVDSEVASVSRVEAHNMAAKNNIENIIVDLSNAKVDGTITELYEFVTSNTQILDKRACHALVFTSDNWDHTRSKFAKYFAERSNLKWEYFKTQDEAIIWLME